MLNPKSNIIRQYPGFGYLPKVVSTLWSFLRSSDSLPLSVRLDGDILVMDFIYTQIHRDYAAL